MKSVFLLYFVLLIGKVLMSQSWEVIVLRPGPDDGKDAYINSASQFALENFGVTQSILSSAYTYSGQYGIGRSLIQFDLSQLPPYKSLTARLSLYYNPTNGHGVQTGDNASYLQRITSSWEEHLVTWINQPTYTEEHQVYLPTSTSIDQDYPDIDVTELVRDMLQPGNENYGFMLNMINTNPYASLIFASSDHPLFRLRPRLELTLCVSPEAYFTYTSQSNVMYFVNQSTHSDQYFWDFGDGFFSNLPEPQHTYELPGVYNVCLTASNSCDSVTICQSVNVCDSVSAAFTYSPLSDQLFQFSNQSYGALNYLWEFGDGSYSLNPEPVHYYSEGGDYEVCLVTTNMCESDTLCSLLHVSASSIRQDQDNGHSVYPNPSAGCFKLFSSHPINNYKLFIINLQGHQVLYNSGYEAGGQLEIPKLVPGIYLLVLNTDTFVYREKIISIE
jgi:PKD repeat protein